MRIILIFLILLFIFFTLTISIATGVSVGLMVFYDKYKEKINAMLEHQRID